MRGDHEALRVGAIVAGAVGFLAGAAVVFVTTGGASSASTEDPALATTGGPALLAYGISGMPADAVIVVQRRNGPKGRSRRWRDPPRRAAGSRWVHPPPRVR